MLLDITRRSCDTFVVLIYVGGNIDDAKRVCRQFCMSVGLCVTVEPVHYIYTGGDEFGVRVGLLNYPRFPATLEQIEEKAEALSDLLRSALSQHSALMVSPRKTVWWSSRGEG